VATNDGMAEQRRWHDMDGGFMVNADGTVGVYVRDSGICC
jgi:hypothetical protein